MRPVPIATAVVAALSMATIVIVARALLVPRANSAWSWEHPARAIVAAVTAALAAVGAGVIAVRSRKPGAAHSARLLGGSLVMVVLTVVSAFVVVRSGAWLSDMQFDLVPG